MTARTITPGRLTVRKLRRMTRLSANQKHRRRPAGGWTRRNGRGEMARLAPGSAACAESLGRRVLTEV